MFTAILFCCCLLGSAFSQNTKTNTLTKTTNNVKGDQSYGGIHLFEWHGEHGGIRLGWKILLALLIILAIGYWWTKKKANKCFGLLPTLLNTQPAAPTPAPAPAPAPAPHINGYPLMLYQPPVPAPRYHQHRRPRDSSGEESA